MRPPRRLCSRNGKRMRCDERTMQSEHPGTRVVGHTCGWGSRARARAGPEGAERSWADPGFPCRRRYAALQQHTRAMDYFEQALMLCRKVGDAWGEALAEADLADTKAALCRDDAAIKHYER